MKKYKDNTYPIVKIPNEYKEILEEYPLLKNEPKPPARPEQKNNYLKQPELTIPPKPKVPERINYGGCFVTIGIGVLIFFGALSNDGMIILSALICAFLIFFTIVFIVGSEKEFKQKKEEYARMIKEYPSLVMEEELIHQQRLKEFDEKVRRAEDEYKKKIHFFESNTYVSRI